MNLDSETMQLPPRPGIAKLSVTNKVYVCVCVCVFVRGEREKSKRRRMPRSARCSISLKIQTSNFKRFRSDLHHPRYVIIPSNREASRIFPGAKHWDEHFVTKKKKQSKFQQKLSSHDFPLHPIMSRRPYSSILGIPRTCSFS
ncbi:hypothetical protein GQ607_011405 [Colletotrichum asianum]|uniref:Uncharacterized protein n=1 Tax=Colletotrichum asianum TaxID=702518 RepID=A0A8H3W8V6_9PEZI|nr:hypothetical protein GQ607_011405 [Colletotrichum asianum]